MARKVNGKVIGTITEVTNVDERKFDITLKNVSLGELVALNNSDTSIQDVCEDLGSKISKLDEEAQEADDARFRD